MERKAISLLMTVIMSCTVFGQCKLIDHLDKGIYRIDDLSCVQKIDRITLGYLLFDRYQFGLGGGKEFLGYMQFGKVADKYHFRSYVADSDYKNLFAEKDKAKPFSYDPGTPIVFLLKNNEKVSLNPVCADSGRIAAGSYHVYCFYDITVDQVRQLAESPVVEVHLYIAPAEGLESERLSKDDEGNTYFKVIPKEKQQDRLMKPASCILASEE